MDENETKYQIEQAFRNGYAQGFHDGADRAFRDGYDRGFLEGANRAAHYCQTPDASRNPPVRQPAYYYGNNPQGFPQQPAQKRPFPKREKRPAAYNLNILLYVGSFLLIAAAAAFIGASVPSHARLAGIAGIAALFYVGGIVLHRRVVSLKPAATAFLGTSLAIIPFIGVAMSALTDISGTRSWLLISAAGLAAYLVAAAVLKSRVVAFLVMAFLLSLVSSAVASASLPIVWYFVALILVAIAAFAIDMWRPGLLPEMYRRPMMVMGRFVTPAALLGSLFVFEDRSPFMYEIIWGLSTLQYLMAWTKSRAAKYELIVRIGAHATILASGLDAADSASGFDEMLFGAAWLAAAVLQFVYSLVWQRFHAGSGSARETVWGGLMLGFMLAGVVFWTADFALITLSLACVAVLSILAVFLFRKIGWAYAALAMSLLLPCLIGRKLLLPALPWACVFGFFALAGVLTVILCLLCRKRPAPHRGVQAFLGTALVCYVVLALVTSALSSDRLLFGGGFTAAAVLLIWFSYAARNCVYEIAGAAALFPSVFLLLYDPPAFAFTVPARWRDFSGLLILFALFGAGTLAHRCGNARHGKAAMRLDGRDTAEVDLLCRGSERKRRDILLLFALAALQLLFFSALPREDPVVVTASVLILAAASLAALALRVLKRGAGPLLCSPFVRIAFAVAYLLWLASAWLLCFKLEPLTLCLVHALIAAMMWFVSYAERKPFAATAGNIFVVAFGLSVWDASGFADSWMFFGVAAAGALLFFAVYLWMLARNDTVRQWICLGSSWALVAVAVIMNAHAHPAAAAVVLLFGAGTLVFRGCLTKRWLWLESGIYAAVAGLQWLCWQFFPGIEAIWYAHCWAIVLATVAWRRRAGKPAYTLARLLTACAAVTLFAGRYALAYGEGYRLLFLTEQIAFLIVGVFLRKQWATWWGAAGTVAAVLYFLKDYLYLWLGFLGLLLVALVIWRLLKASKKS